MPKVAALGTVLNIGIQQVESTPVVGTITGNGNATFTITKAGMTGSPLAVSVAVLQNDTTDTTATKTVAALNGTPNFAAKCLAWCSGSVVYVMALVAIANDATMNIAYTNGTCTGLTPDATSDHTIAGVVPTALAYISNISGPGLKSNTDDVTTHDQATAWEEQVVTILNSNDIKLDLVYDPNNATQKNSAGGMLYYMVNKTLVYGQLVFPGPYTWSFQARFTDFEPDGPVDSALTAKAVLNITGAPTLV